MPTIGLYFPDRFTQQQVNELRARLNALAAELGYRAQAGSTAGQGNLSAMLIALDAGEVEVRKRPQE